MRRLVAFVCTILMVTLLLPLQPTWAAEANAKPKVIPSLQEWTGGTGLFTLTTRSRITVDPNYAGELTETANVFKTDLREVTGLDITIETTHTPAVGDFFLTLNEETDETIGEEGYFFEVDDVLTIRANTNTGVFYGTRTALQILVQDPEGKSIVKGVAKDYPKYETRGFMLDVGRKFFPMAFLEDYVKVMSWYKMNDFHLHLNDNAIFKDNSREHWDQYSAFRLESETYPELTATDGHYTKEQFRELQDLAKEHALTITPEFDTPAHALAFTKVRPDLVHPDLPVDHLDITREETVEFVKSVWDEYLDLFDAEQIHIGADEFYRNDREMSNVYREYINTLHRHLKKKGKTARAWGGLSYYQGDVPVDQDVVFNAWNIGWYNPEQAVNEGYKIINTDDGLLYIVPKAGYYHDYLNTNWLYNNWEPTVFSGSIRLSEDEPNLLGGMFAVWNDMLGKTVSVPDVHDRVRHAMPTLAEKMWRGQSDEATFAEFEQLSDAIGGAPGTNLTYEVETKSDTLIHYSFDNETGVTVEDSSGNNYHGTLNGGERTDEGRSGQAIVFNSPTDHITTGLETKGFPWTVSAWVNLEENDQAEAILLESPYSAIKLKQKETGKAGFTREGYDFSFNTAIPTGRWVHVTFRGDINGTSLFIDGELQETLPDNTLLPIGTIGSETRSFKGALDDLIIFDRTLSASEIAEYADAPPWRINIAAQKPAEASSIEVDYLTPDLAFDENDSTRWSSGYTDNEWIYVDLLEQYSINKVVLKWEDAYATGYKIQVSNDAENWKDVYTTDTGTGGTEVIHFPVENARYVRMLGTKRAINWGFSLYEFEVYQPITAGDVKERIVERLEEQGEFADESVARSLKVHLTAVDHFETEESAEKVVKHVEGFKRLLDHQRENALISERAYNILKDNADDLIQKWQ